MMLYSFIVGQVSFIFICFTNLVRWMARLLSLILWIKRWKCWS